jgi:hypothetical protein
MPPRKTPDMLPHLNFNGEEIPRDDPRLDATVLVLSQIRDSLISLSTTVTDVRDRVIKMETQNALGQLQEFKAEFEKYKSDREKLKETAFDRISKLELQNAQWRGTFLPLTILGTGIMAAVVAFVMEAVLK